MDEDPLGSGSLSFHQIGLIISAIFGLVATFIALWLIYLHGTHYSRPWEQKHIIRILFMIPIYAVVSFLSFKYYPHAIYFQVIRDCYEAFAIASFFTLLCHYVAPSLHDQKDYFRSQKPKNWVLPLNWFQKCTGGKFKGPLRLPTSGLTWFNVCSWPRAFFVRPSLTVVIDNVDWHLPILLRPHLHDLSGPGHTGNETILRLFLESSICPHLGFCL